MRFLLWLLALAALPASAQPAVVTGAQRLTESDFAALDGLRVGLVTNHTARVDTTDAGPAHLIDRLHAAANVTLAALFGPEHGLRGTAEAGAPIDSGVDPATGVPVYSLYGSAKKPPPEALRDLDALVFDMQDIGARFYTYISTMGYAMQAAAEAGIPFVVLDRPNPLGGRTSGFVREPAFASFVGLYPIPIQHGLTVGELARMIRGEGWLPGLDALDLRVIEMDGWRRDMLWPDTGLPWVPTSPNIPDFETALVYPGIALFEGTSVSEGRGTDTPFRLIGAPWLDGAALAAEMNALDLPGVRFEPTHFTPRSISGIAARPKFEGEEIAGVRIVVTNPHAVRPVEFGVHLLHAVYAQCPAGVIFFDSGWLAKLAGTDLLHAALWSGLSPPHVIRLWAPEYAPTAPPRSLYLLYD